MNRWGFSMVLAGVLASGVMAADWPGYLGINGDGVSPETGLLKKWPAKGPKEAWSIKVGNGFGGAAIKAGKVYVLDRVAGEADILRVFDLDTGKESWSFKYDAKIRLSHPGSRSIPAVTDTHVYTVGQMGHVHAIDLKTKKPTWTFDTNPKNEPLNKWGVAQSALVYDGKVILPMNSKSAPGLVALDAKTGKQAWATENFGGDNYCTPLVRKVDGKVGILFVVNDMVIHVDPASGKPFWKHKSYYCKFPIPGPTVLPDGNHILVSGAYDSDSVMLEVKGGKVTEKFKLKGTGAHIHTPIVHGDHIYMNFSQNSNLKRKKETAGLGCLDPKTGKILWRTGSKDTMDRGGLIWVDGQLIMLHGKDGTLMLVDPSPSGYKEVSRFKLFKGNEKIWSPMALSDGRLVLRDQTVLKCLDLRAK